MIVDVSRVLDGIAPTIGVAPNVVDQVDNPNNVAISHQSDVSADGKVLVVTDERGGGLDNTDCNTGPGGIIGAAHFWALQPIDGVPASAGASPASPKKLGIWVYPNPGLLADPLQPVLASLGRTERACTIHVFRLGGNGSLSPGEAYPGMGGVSGLPIRQLTTGHYGAGVWWLDFSGAPSSGDGIAEEARTTWGNTRGWNVMPGAETWSAKEYKGFVYASDMGRGFDVYSFTSCDGPGCVLLPTNAPGKATGGGQIAGELAELSILRGKGAGGRASLGFNAQYQTGQAAPTGHLTFIDHGTGKKVQSTSITSFRVAGRTASFSGTATVNGVPGISFFVEVEDLGEPGSADTFRLVVGDGYGSGGVLLNGNIQVSGPDLVSPLGTVTAL